MEILEIKEDYFNVGSSKDIVVSNSSLSYLNEEEGGGILKFLNYLDKKSDSKETKSMELGSLVHALLEDENIVDTFCTEEFEKPTSMMAQWVERVFIKNKGWLGTPSAFILQEKKDAYVTLKDSDKILEKFEKEGGPYYLFLDRNKDKKIIDQKLLKDAKKCLENINKDRIAFQLIDNAVTENMIVQNELEIYWKYLGIKCKSKLDRVVIDNNKKTIKLVDYKTTGKPIYFFKDSFNKYRYYRQMAFYKEALSYLYPDYEIEVFIIAVETFGTFECQVYKMTEETLDKGFMEFRNLLNSLLDHIELDFNIELNNKIINL